MTFICVGPACPLVDLSDRTINNKRFYKTPAGKEYPSITTILNHEEKQGIADWKKALGPEKAARETKRCSDRGTQLHNIVENYLKNVDITKFKDNKYFLHFNQIKLLLKKINNIHVQEAALYSDELRIAGRVDCIAEYNNRLSIIDFKTATNNKDSNLIEDYYIQATAYALMYYELTGVLIEDIVIIMSVEKGLPSVFCKKIYDYIAPLMEKINKFYGV